MVRGQIRGHPDELDSQPVTGGRVAWYSEEAVIQERAAHSRAARARSVMVVGVGGGSGGGGRRGGVDCGGRGLAPGLTVGLIPLPPRWRAPVKLIFSEGNWRTESSQKGKQKESVLGCSSRRARGRPCARLRDPDPARDRCGCGSLLGPTLKCRNKQETVGLPLFSR